MDQIEEEYLKKVEQLDEVIFHLNVYINAFKEVMEQCQESPYTLESFDINFNEKYERIRKSLNDLEVGNETTNEDVEKLISTDHPEDYMDEYVEIIEEKVNSIIGEYSNLINLTEMIVFQMFDVAETQIASGGDNYEKLLLKTELIGMLEDMSKSYNYSKSEERKDLNDVKSILEEIKDKGQSLYQYLNSHRDSNGKLLLDGRTKTAKEFLKFLDFLGDAGKAIKLTDNVIEKLISLFTNYDKNLEFLDSFERNACLEGDMKAAFNEIRAKYEHSIEETLDNIRQSILKDGTDALLNGELLIAGTPLAIVASIKKTIGFVGKLTGEDEITANKLAIMNNSNDLIRTSKQALTNAITRLKELKGIGDGKEVSGPIGGGGGGSRDSEDIQQEYDQAVNDVKNCFDMYKNSVKRLFGRLVKVSYSPEKEYYEYCSQQMSRLSLKQSEPPAILSYDEYQKLSSSGRNYCVQEENVNSNFYEVI